MSRFLKIVKDLGPQEKFPEADTLSCIPDLCPERANTRTKDPQFLDEQLNVIMNEGDLNVYDLGLKGLKFAAEQSPGLRNYMAKYGWTAVLELNKPLQGIVFSSSADTGVSKSGKLLSFSSRPAYRDLIGASQNYGLVIAVDRTPSIYNNVDYYESNPKNKFSIKSARLYLGEFNDVSCLENKSDDPTEYGYDSFGILKGGRIKTLGQNAIVDYSSELLQSYDQFLRHQTMVSAEAECDEKYNSLFGSTTEYSATTEYPTTMASTEASTLFEHAAVDTTTAFSSGVDTTTFGMDIAEICSVKCGNYKDEYFGESTTQYPTGTASTADYSTGTASTAEYSTGTASTVEYSTATASTADYSTGTASTADYSTGTASTAEYSTGTASTAEYSTGTASTADYSTGTASTAEYSTGTASTAGYSTGTASTADYSTGTASTAEYSTGTASTAEYSTGTASTVEYSTGTASTAEYSTGTASTAEYSTGTASTAEYSTGTASTAGYSTGTASTAEYSTEYSITAYEICFDHCIQAGGIF